MTPEKVIAVAEQYREMLKVYQPVRLTDTQQVTSKIMLSIHDIRGHARFMCDEIIAFAKSEPPRMGKAFRWLGFLQGIMWMLGEETLDEAKKRNMPTLEEKAEEDAAKAADARDLEGLETLLVRLQGDHRADTKEIMAVWNARDRLKQEQRL